MLLQTYIKKSDIQNWKEENFNIVFIFNIGISITSVSFSKLTINLRKLTIFPTKFPQYFHIFAKT